MTSLSTPIPLPSTRLKSALDRITDARTSAIGVDAMPAVASGRSVPRVSVHKSTDDTVTIESDAVVPRVADGARASRARTGRATIDAALRADVDRTLSGRPMRVAPTSAVVRGLARPNVDAVPPAQKAAPSASFEAPATPRPGVDANHPKLRALAQGRLVGARTGLCVTATLDNMERNGVAQPAATGRDSGNNPRGGMVQLIRDFGWKSLPGVGAPQPIKSPYGTVHANVIPAADYERLARGGHIPSGAVVFQTRHPSWNMTSPRSSGFDMGIARDGGRTLFNFADMGGPMVYPNTKSVVVLVPSDAIR